MQDKKILIDKIKLHESDTGSANVQITSLSHDIGVLTNHLNKHKKDVHAKKGLINKVNKRKQLLKYLKRKNNVKYMSIIKYLSIRK